MATYVKATTLLLPISCIISGTIGGVRGENSVWKDPGKIAEADWETVDVLGKPPYTEMARYAAAHYESPSGFRLAVEKVLLTERRIFDGDAKYKVIFSFVRTNCTNADTFKASKCQPLSNETTGQCTASMRQHEDKKDFTVDWMQCIDYV